MNIQPLDEHILASKTKVAISQLKSESSANEVDDSGDKARALEPKSRKLPVLLPKPIPLPKPSIRRAARPRLQPQPPSQPRSRSGPAPSGPCGIPQCDQVPCRLVSHHQRTNIPARNTRKEIKANESNRDVPLSRRQSIVSASTASIQSTIAKGAGFPALPWTGSEQSDPILRQLFHDFFVKLVNRLLTIIIPPFQGYPEWLRGRHQELFQNGTKVQLDCINFVGAAHAYVSIRSRSDLTTADPVGIMIHNDLMKNLRDTLEQYDAERDADQVLNAIYTLVLEDLCTPESQTGQTSLLAHRAAMERIVSSRGGLHNMMHSITLAVSLDRLIALQVGQPPRYSTWQSATLPIQRASLYPAVYGEFFNVSQYSRKIDDQISTYCSEVNRAIEILEGEGWQFDGEIRESTPEIFYLYYLRDRVETKFVFLNARLLSEDTKDRCILLAAKLVAYVVLMDDYVAATTLLVAHQLATILKKQDIRNSWQGWEDVFQWIAFVLACLPDYYKDKEWATSMCFGSLQRFYGKKNWPAGWQSRQLENLTRFVWSTERFDDAFQKTCGVLQAMARQTSTDGKRKFEMTRP